MTEVLPGGEPFAHAGGPAGVLVLHGFTGTPQSVRPVAAACAAADFTVEAPLLPGHGTVIADMLGTTWDDYAAAVEASYADLARRCAAVVVAGLSMGGTLAAWLATRRADVAGLVLVNAAVLPSPEGAAEARALLDSGVEVAPPAGSDVADPDAVEVSYAGSPLRPLLSLHAAIEELFPRLVEIRCPALVVSSTHDHIVDPAASDALAVLLSGPVERLMLERSFHVATIDFDRDLVAERTVDFCRRVKGR